VTCNGTSNFVLKLNSIASADSTKTNLITAILATAVYTNQVIFLRLTMDFTTSKSTALYSVDGRAWTPLGGQVNIAYDWLTGTFQGEQYAIFCYSPQPSTGFVDVDWFRMEPPAVISSIAPSGNSGVTLRLASSPNSTNVIQTSSNLGPATLWQNISTNKANTNGTWLFTDTNADSIPARFYRTFDLRIAN